MKKQKGITLIALVISIIVMLILAGVSINAVVGDNGILTKAMQTGYLQSIAVLEEFLQMEYSTYTVDANEYNTALALLKAKQSNWFYKSAEGYVLDSDGHVLYLINKAGLPEDIQKQLRGGDCDKISQYYKQEDVYGVTSDLKVYYCKNGTDTILGLTTEDLDKDNPLEIVYDSDSLLAKLVNGTDENGNALKELSAQDLKKITELTIDDVEKYQLLSTFSNLPNLSKVVFKDVELDNITGISGATNLKEVRFENSSIANYTDLRKCTKLNKLYLLLPPKYDEEVSTLCSVTVGIGNTDFTNLEYFAINGFPPAIGSLDKSVSIETYGYNVANRYKITNVDVISQLSEKTKQSIKYLYLNNLQIKSLENALTGFSNVSVFRVSYNSLNTLKGIENLTNLEYLFADNQLTTTFGVNDVTAASNSESDALASISGLTNLKHLDLSANAQFKWSKYLKNLNNLEYLNLDKCTSILDFYEIANLVNSLGLKAIYPGSLAQDLISNTSEYLNLANNTISETDFRKLNGSKNLIALNLNSTKILKDDGSEFSEEEITQLFYDVLNECTNMKHLDLSSQNKLTNIQFISKMSKLNDLNLNNCIGISDLSLLEELTVANKMNLNCLILSNELIDLTTIQTVISNLGKNNYNESNGVFKAKLNPDDQSIANFWYSANAMTNSDEIVGLILQKSELISQLENCTNITNLLIYPGWRNYFTRFDHELDLSACTLLKSFVIYNQRLKITLPASLEIFNYMYPNGATEISVDFSRCNNLQYIYTFCLNIENQYNELFSTIPANLNTVKCITIRDQRTYREGTDEDVIMSNDLNYLSHFSNCKNLTKFSLQQNNTFTNYQFKNLDGLQYLTGLKELELLFLTDWGCDAVFPDLSGLTNLESLKITDGSMDLTNINTCNNLKKLIINNTTIDNVNFLSNITGLEEIDLSNNTLKDVSGLANSRKVKTLNLSNNNLTDVYPLIHLNALDTLRLENNKLTDFSYDASGKNYYTLTVFMDLNDVGSLKKLYINGNLIDNFTMITESGLKWDELVIE